MLPNGNMYPSSGELFGPRAFKLAAYDTRSGHLPYFIPTTAPLGTYVYYGFVGTYPSDWDDDYFKFDVIP
jgi:hypothetical protein